MTDPRKMYEFLGIDPKKLAEKCSKFTMEVTETIVVTGDMPSAHLANSVETLFTDKEKTYMTIAYLLDKAEKIMSDPSSKELLKAAIIEMKRQAARDQQDKKNSN